jgi:hypothetical protein
VTPLPGQESLLVLAVNCDRVDGARDCARTLGGDSIDKRCRRLPKRLRSTPFAANSDKTRCVLHLSIVCVGLIHAKFHKGAAQIKRFCTKKVGPLFTVQNDRQRNDKQANHFRGCRTPEFESRPNKTQNFTSANTICTPVPWPSRAQYVAVIPAEPGARTALFDP